MNIFVGNLSCDLEAEELRDCFAEFGEVVDVRVITDPETGLSRGYGFVTMSDRLEAKEAMGRLNRISLRGKPIYLEQARAKRSRQSQPHH
ncbi:RNA recognition motif domain-containing protein [Marinobacterium jannaschii]|uniref:RNA recognition motif domain-containing protein n=1 Tax=Marinobacterium jannaschii TaxID=64970 RepID=UPI0004866DA6|nr:hypothetical protein [Marinobacterium jannaschii]